MNFKHCKNLQESIDGMKKIFSISWSPNLMRLAVAHVDEKRSVRITLYDENGEKREHFPTRAANKVSYCICLTSRITNLMSLGILHSPLIVPNLP